MLKAKRVQFSVTTLLIGVALICGTLAIQRSYVLQRQQAVEYIEGLGGRLEYAREFVERRGKADGKRERDSWLSRLLDRRADDASHVIGVDLHKVGSLPPMNEIAAELRHFPNLLTVTFPNLLDGDDYIRGVLQRVEDVGYYTEGPVRNNRTDPNTSPDFIRAMEL